MSETLKPCASAGTEQAEFVAPVVLITGSSRGIGKAAALEFARQGWTVIVHGSHAGPEALETIDEVRRSAPESELMAADLKDRAALQDLFARIKKRYGRLDAMVCCAGMTRDALLLRAKEEDFDAVMQVNLKAAFLCAKEASRLMMRQKKGAIVFFSSVIALCGNPGQTVYGASKAGLIGLMRSLALELAGRSVRVNAVAPGMIDTDMTRALDEKQQQAMLSRIPMGRAGTPQEAAKAALFLCQEDSAYITGQVLEVNGGLHLG